MIKVLEGQLNADISDPRIVIRPDVRCPQGIIMEIDVLRYFLMCGKKGKDYRQVMSGGCWKDVWKGRPWGCSPRQRAILLIMLRPLRAPRGNWAPECLSALLYRSPPRTVQSRQMRAADPMQSELHYRGGGQSNFRPITSLRRHPWRTKSSPRCGEGHPCHGHLTSAGDTSSGADSTTATEEGLSNVVQPSHRNEPVPLSRQGWDFCRATLQFKMSIWPVKGFHITIHFHFPRGGGQLFGVFLLMQISLNLGNWLYFLPFPGSTPLC